jgi:hypothetical protein
LQRGQRHATIVVARSRGSLESVENMADYSCYLTIFNNTPYKMTFSESGDKWGYWNIAPPATINPFEASLQFQLKDRLGHNGTEGFVKYTMDVTELELFVLNFCCPYYDDNYCDISNPNHFGFGVSFFARSDAGDHNNFCPPKGFPLTMTFHISSFV